MRDIDSTASCCDFESLNRIVEDIWLTLELSPLRHESRCEDVDLPYYARVYIDGDETAVVVVRATANLAEAIAGRMFVEALDTGMLLDAVGEIGNQIAGGVKGLLSGECALHVPQAGVGADSRPLSAPTCVAHWESDVGVLSVRVWTGAPSRENS